MQAHIIYGKEIGSMERVPTPWYSFNLGSLFQRAQKAKNNSTNKNKNKNKKKNSKQGNTMGAALSSSSSSSSSGPSKLTEEEIMAQAAKWEAENNENRARRAELAKAKLAKNIANNATRNKSKNAANLAKFKANFAKREKARLDATMWPDYMEEMYPGSSQGGPVYEMSATAEPYRPPPGYTSAASGAAGAAGAGAAGAGTGTGRKQYNPYGTVRYNGTPRFYRKNRKLNTRKNRR